MINVVTVSFNERKKKRKYFECSNVYCKSEVYEDYEEDGYYYCLHCDTEHHGDEVKWKTEYKEVNKNDLRSV